MQFSFLVPIVIDKINDKEKWTEEFGRNDMISKMLSRGIKVTDVALCTGYSINEINKIVGL